MIQSTNANANRRAAEHFWAQLKQGRPPNGDTSILLNGYAGERLRLATFRHAPHVLTSESIARPHRQAALLSLQLEGDSCVEQHGRYCTVNAGDFYLLDLSRSFRMETRQSTVQTIYLPIAVLRDAVPQVEQASAVVLHGHLSSVGYLRVLYQEIFARASQLTESVAGYLLDAIPHMLAAALQSNAPAYKAPSSQLRQHYKQLVRRFARDHLGDPGLCAETISKGVGLSTSYLFELFADEEATLMRWVRSERLSRCRREFEDPTARRKSIAQVAYSWGFGDMAHFSRCFREVFGVSPRGYRQNALFGMHEK
ncbi:helix-turn-helix domain-containing protein [Rhodanobacter sp. A1T4]|jgi:AraC-like DNA-binding protein|uniref:helix-turn-helix domain-containing protein n=1 Tax=Rhodanobacter sp. A1T4 TaxID=2723087 RepID=UPI001607031F|nr:helix-turn-helix domain-containing protein [Rhodanobacter sp. A1T4]MBB6245699.1 AraC-like DNA-binding protein [Rhodanobacter sp. A1T4]